MVETKKSAKVNKETDLDAKKQTDLKAEAATAATNNNNNNKRPLEKEQQVDTEKQEPQGKKIREDLIPAEVEVIIHQTPDLTEEEKLAIAEAARKEEELRKAESGKKQEEMQQKEEKLPESASQEKKTELPSKEKEKEQLSKTREEKTSATSAK
jgi:hypothetical protein